ncbi:MAG TPA: HhH-GPD-type base excision DNA repair protein [Acidimicrobiales bacterium]|nr:HhH-GPD-type base excision DNA repair protein [Acidimicrobiales bacterium]
MPKTKPLAIAVTGDYEADLLVSTDPLALTLSMLLDQQVPMERAFHSPYDLKERLGGRLDAAEIAGMDAEELVVVFRGPPALHRYPGSMAGRTQELCRVLVEQYDGNAEAVWKGAATGKELVANLKALPGFGEQKARIFTALLAKRMGVTPPGWEDVTGPYGQAGHFSVADIDGPEALAAVREHKKAMKAAAKAGK